MQFQFPAHSHTWEQAQHKRPAAHLACGARLHRSPSHIQTSKAQTGQTQPSDPRSAQSSLTNRQLFSNIEAENSNKTQNLSACIGRPAHCGNRIVHQLHRCTWSKGGSPASYPSYINGAIDAAWAQFDQSCHHEPMLSSEAPLLVLQRVSRDGQIARISVLQGQFSADIIGWYRGSVGLQPRHCRQTRAGHENYFRVIRLLFEINS
jgi:hypothetical protein